MTQLFPTGDVLINGTADYASQPNKALLDSVALNGDVSSKELLVRTPQLKTAIRNLAAHYQVANGNAEVRDLRASVLGGEITGQATVRDLSGKEEGTRHARLHNISLADAKSLANTASLKQISLRGDVNGTVDATWNGSRAERDCARRCDGELDRRASAGGRRIADRSA